MSGTNRVLVPGRVCLGREQMARSEGAIAARFRRRMHELGLSEDEVWERAQVGGVTYNLLGSTDDLEFYEAFDLWEVKRVVDALGLNLLDLLGLESVDCTKTMEPWRHLADLPRNEIISRRRGELGLSQDELLTKLGWTQWVAEHSGPEFGKGWAEGIMRRYRAMEDSPDSIEELTLEAVMQVAQAIEVPPQLLLGVSANTCRFPESEHRPGRHS
jgi:hypothetical protein